MSDVNLDAPGPQPPAGAYLAMENVLPSWFHHRPPPPKGTSLTVTGTDGVVTIWHMTDGLAGATVPLVAASPAVLRIVTGRYDRSRDA